MPLTPTVEPPGDYYAPFYRVWFFSPDASLTLNDDGIPVLQNGEPVAQVSSDDSFAESTGLPGFSEEENVKILRAYASSLVIEGVSSSAYKATLTLTPPYDDAVRILESGLIRFGAVMLVRWGYFTGGRPIVSPNHLFHISQPSAKFGLATTLTITGYDLYSRTAQDRQVFAAWSRELYPNDVAILEEVVLNLGTGMVLDSAAVPKESTLKQLGQGTGWEQKESYWRFFRRVCNAHKVGWTVKGNRILLFDHNDVTRQEPSYRLLWRTAPTEDHDIPIIDISINPLRTIFQNVPATRGVRQNTPTLDTGTVDQRDVNAANAPGNAVPTGSNRTATAPGAEPAAATSTPAGAVQPGGRFPPGTTGDHHMPSSRSVNPNGQTESELVAAEQQANTTAQVRIPGHPLIEPQQIVKVIGLPENFAGNYLIRSVKHTLGVGYTIDLDLYSRVPTQNTRGEGRPTRSATNQTTETAPAGEEVTARDEDGNVAEAPPRTPRRIG